MPIRLDFPIHSTQAVAQILLIDSNFVVAVVFVKSNWQIFSR
jgi:hypothetical protein